MKVDRPTEHDFLADGQPVYWKDGGRYWKIYV